jgi:hypothetical protein
MIVAYLTTDDANEDLALQVADECGVALYRLTLEQAPPISRCQALLCDWDSLPSHGRSSVLFEYLTHSGGRVVAVHGVTLDEEEAETLHDDGVAVFQHLGPEVFRTLRRLTRGLARPAHCHSRRHRQPHCTPSLRPRQYLGSSVPGGLSGASR